MLSQQDGKGLQRWGGGDKRAPGASWRVGQPNGRLSKIPYLKNESGEWLREIADVNLCFTHMRAHQSSHHRPWRHLDLRQGAKQASLAGRFP